MKINPTYYDKLSTEQKISLNLHLARLSLGLSKEDLAKKVNMVPKVIGTIETLYLYPNEKRRSLKLEDIEVLCKAMNISTSSVYNIFEGDD